MKAFWNERYSKEKYAYGHEPNVYFKEQINKFEPGKILLPAEGEGRNAVYAAQLAWDVSAFDWSEEAMKKAMLLAKNKEVKINYQLGILEDLEFELGQFDVVALIYAHFAPDLKSKYHKMLNEYLKPGGHFIFEAFSKSHLKYNSKNPTAGGPKNADMLFSIDEVKNDFENFEIIELKEEIIDLYEGDFHNGQSAVIRFIGKKIS